MPKISVIIPCLNSVKYIRETMESLVNQTLSDIEMLVVDAGSTDGTLEILREYTKSDERVRLMHSDKKSMGYQYNLGIDASSGEYIGFVETDDYIELTMYEELYTEMRANKVDYVKSDFEMFADLQGERLFLRYRPLPPAKRNLYGNVMNIFDCPGLILKDVNIWNGIYSKDFICAKKIRFNETPGAAFQDIGFVLQTLIYAANVMYIDRSHYRYRRDNLDSSVFNKNACSYVIWEFEYVLNRFSDSSTEAYRLCESLVYFRFFESFSNTLRSASLRNDLPPDEVTEKALSFASKFQSAIENSEFALRSWVLPGMSRDMSLLINDYKQFCIRAKEIAEHNRKLLYDWVLHLKQQPEIVLFGAGEIGGSVLCYLRCNGIDIVGFCDNDKQRWGTSYMNRKVFSPAEAAEKYPNAMYVVSVIEELSIEIKSQLVKSGINPIKICSYVNLIAAHTSFELEVLPKLSISPPIT